MKDFASYQGPDKENAGAEEWVKEAKSYAAGYNGRNENDMVREIYARAAEGKKNGTLTNEQIDYFFAQFAPMLDAGKRKRLQKLVNQLKSM